MTLGYIYQGCIGICCARRDGKSAGCFQIPRAELNISTSIYVTLCSRPPLSSLPMITVVNNNWGLIRGRGICSHGGQIEGVMLGVSGVGPGTWSVRDQRVSSSGRTTGWFRAEIW